MKPTTVSLTHTQVNKEISSRTMNMHGLQYLVRISLSVCPSIYGMCKPRTRKAKAQKSQLHPGQLFFPTKKEP